MRRALLSPQEGYAKRGSGSVCRAQAPGAGGLALRSWATEIPATMAPPAAAATVSFLGGGRWIASLPGPAAAARAARAKSVRGSSNPPLAAIGPLARCETAATLICRARWFPPDVGLRLRLLHPRSGFSAKPTQSSAQACEEVPLGQRCARCVVGANEVLQ